MTTMIEQKLKRLESSPQSSSSVSQGGVTEKEVKSWIKANKMELEASLQKQAEDIPTKEDVGKMITSNQAKIEKSIQGLVADIPTKQELTKLQKSSGSIMLPAMDEAEVHALISERMAMLEKELQKMVKEIPNKQELTEFVSQSSKNSVEELMEREVDKKISGVHKDFQSRLERLSEEMINKIFQNETTTEQKISEITDQKISEVKETFQEAFQVLEEQAKSESVPVENISFSAIYFSPAPNKNGLFFSRKFSPEKGGGDMDKLYKIQVYENNPNSAIYSIVDDLQAQKIALQFSHKHLIPGVILPENGSYRDANEILVNQVGTLTREGQNWKIVEKAIIETK